MKSRFWWMAAGSGALLGALLAWRAFPSRDPFVDPDGTSARALAPALLPEMSLPLAAGVTDVAVMFICTFRRDRLQAYGSPRPSSPFLQQLAENGVLFNHTIVQAPWTRPSVGSLITGIWPGLLQLDDPSETEDTNRALAERHTTLAEHLQAAGYTTIGVSGNPNVSSVFGFQQGFDVYQEPDHFIREATDPPTPGSTLVEALLRNLDQAGDGPLYLQGMFVDTHVPRNPSPRALQVMKTDPTPLPARAEEQLNNYDAAVRTLDGTLARLFIELKKRRPNMLFIVIGDHGEGLYLPRHHGQAHGNYLYTSAIDVPFLVYHPALPAPGRQVEGLATGLDLVPTVLDILQIPLPPGLDGLSQAPALRGLTDRSPHDLAFSETWFRFSHRTTVLHADLGYHLIHNHTLLPRDRRGPVELYRHDDALEEVDLAGSRPGVVEDLSGLLGAWEQALNTRIAAEGPALEAIVPDSTREQLQVLGYVD